MYGFFHYHKKTSSLRHIISFVLRHVICKCAVVVSMLSRKSPFLAMTKLMFLMILRWSSRILYTSVSKHVKFQAWTVLPILRSVEPPKVKNWYCIQWCTRHLIKRRWSKSRLVILELKNHLRRIRLSAELKMPEKGRLKEMGLKVGLVLLISFGIGSSLCVCFWFWGVWVGMVKIKRDLAQISIGEIQ